MTYLASFTQYLELPKCPVAFLPPDVKNNLAETVSLNGKQQFHIAETLKDAHVTYFFNGLHNQPYEKEMDVLIDSAKDVEAEPAMRSDQIAKRILQEMGNGYDLIVANFANADMLAHTGNYEATRAGVEAIDAAIGMILEKVLAMNAILLITADHGNAEKLIDRITSEPESKHGNNPVPFYLIGSDYKGLAKPLPKEQDITGILADVAPTIIKLLGLTQPSLMTGKSLL